MANDGLDLNQTRFYVAGQKLIHWKGTKIS